MVKDISQACNTKQLFSALVCSSLFFLLFISGIKNYKINLAWIHLYIHHNIHTPIY